MDAKKATLDQYLEIGEQIKSGRLDRASAQAVIEGRFQILIDGILVLEDIVSGKPFKLVVDYSLAKAQMINAGYYNYANEFLRDNDPVEGRMEGTGIVEGALKLIRLNRAISTKDALEEIKKRGQEPARIEHLLALGAKYPNSQKEFPIVALGSVWQFPDNRRRVAYLYGWDDGRGIDLRWTDYDWHKDSRFLVVCPA